MSNPVVAIARFEKPGESVRKVVSLCNGLAHLPSQAKVFIKPNVVFWTTLTPFPKWGVITTSRIVEDMVCLLKEHGIENITIGEGMVTHANDFKTPAHAFDYLGYERLRKRYGVNFLNVMERPFEKIEVDEGISLKFNTDILNSDFVVNLPVLKTHVQTVVSLGIKNLKGTIDMPSRKKCHSPDPVRDLHYLVARLADKMPPMFTLLDGIFTNERGPGADGRIHRSDLLVASADVLAADMVGSQILGYDPREVPYVVHAAQNIGRSLDLADIDVVGEPVEAVQSKHEFDYEYVQNDNGHWMPTPLVKEGLAGFSYPKYDSTMCTYCSQVNGLVLGAIRAAWKGEAWDQVEILTGKSMKPTPGMKKTVLLGKCMYKANKDNPDINSMFAVKGCPPQPESIVKALHEAGIMVDKGIFEQAEYLPGLLMRRYEGKPEFDEAFFQIA